jgi:hypothetical protein
MKRTSYPRPVTRSIKVAAVVTMAMAGLLFATVQRGRVLQGTRTLRELPSTARAVLRIDTRALERTEAANTLIGTFVPKEQLSEIEAVCGLDPLTALSDVTIWVRGSDDQPLQSIGLMLRGRMVDAVALAECHRLLVEARGGSVVRLDGPAGAFLASQDRRSAVALLDDRTIVTGSVSTVAEAMAVRRGTVSALVERSQIAALWPEVSAGASVAAVLEPPEHWRSALERMGKLGGHVSALREVRTVALAIPARSKQTIELFLDIADAEVAARDAELIRTWAASPPDSVEPPWTDILRSARLEVLGKRIVVTLDVSSLSAAR